jgi:hypothetical protein
MTEELEFDDAGLDVWSDEETFEVTRDRLVEYAEATNDPIAAHRNGDVANPVFAIVPVFESLLIPAVDVMPVELIPRVVHGEQDFHFRRAIKPATKASTTAPAQRSCSSAEPRTANWSTSNTSPRSSAGSTQARRSAS